MEYTVIIPALNPDERLRNIIDQNWEMKNQIILVNDGSDIEYMPLFAELGEKCIVLHHRENRGKGEAIKTALRYIKSELWECSVIGIMDADGQHLPEDMERLLTEAALHPGTLILGCRSMNGEIPWRSRVGNQVTKMVFRMAAGTEISDTQTGLRAFSSELANFMLEIPGERYEYEMNVLLACAKKSIPILEVPIQTIYHDRKNRCSHFKKVRDSVRIYRQFFKFSSASISSFLVDYVLFVLFTVLFPEGAGFIAAANIMARILSAAYNYMVNCRLVFHEKPSVKTAADYAALAVCILTLNSILLQIFSGALQFSVYPAKILTECILFAASWLIQKQIIFKTGRNIFHASERGEKI